MLKHNNNNKMRVFRRRQRQVQPEQQQQQQHPCASTTLLSLSEELKALDFIDHQPLLEQPSKHHFTDFVQACVTAQDKTQWHKTSTLLAAKSKLLETMNIDYTQVLLDANASDSLASAHVAAAHHLLQQFLDIQPMLIEHTSMADSLQDLLFGLLEGYLRPRLTDHFGPLLVQHLTAGEAANIITFMEHFRTKLATTCPNVSPSPLWRSDREQLLQIYLDKAVRGEMRTQIDNCVGQQANVRQDVDGHMVSNTPSAVIYMMDQQLCVAKSCLPASYLGHVLAACNQEIRSMIGDFMLQTGTYWRLHRTDWFCAMVNDAARLAELVEERNDEYLQRPDHVEDGQATVREFLELSLLAVDFMVEHIMAKLRDPADPILTSIGSQAWEVNQGESSAVERTLATLDDYLCDIAQWLSGSFYFPKVLKKCFDLTLQTYVESFYASTLSNGVRNPAQVAALLETDYQDLVRFFSGRSFDRYHGKAGYYSEQTVQHRLHIIQCLAKLVNPEVEAEDAASNVEVLLREFNDCEEAGTPAVLHLVGLRKRHTVRESVEWLRVLSQARKQVRSERETSVFQSMHNAVSKSARQLFSTSQRSDSVPEPVTISTSTTSSSSSSSCQCPNNYKLVDLRNSRYLYNVRARGRDMARRISAESMALAHHTTKLLSAAKKPTSRLQRTVTNILTTAKTTTSPSASS